MSCASIPVRVHGCPCCVESDQRDCSPFVYVEPIACEPVVSTTYFRHVTGTLLMNVDMTRSNLFPRPACTCLPSQARFYEYLTFSDSFMATSVEQGSVDTLPVVSDSHRGVALHHVVERYRWTGSVNSARCR